MDIKSEIARLNASIKDIYHYADSQARRVRRRIHRLQAKCEHEFEKHTGAFPGEGYEECNICGFRIDDYDGINRIRT